MKKFKKSLKPQVIQIFPEKILAYKPVGFTPLEVIEYIKHNYPDYKDQKIGYAGRLDPMADGLVLLLLGTENKNKIKYENLDKKYRFECTFGIETDSLDVLGLVLHVNAGSQNHPNNFQLKKKLPYLQGDVSLQYPVYSSKRVKGKPLYYWAKRGKIDQITIPSRESKIYSVKFISSTKKTGEEIAQNAIANITKIKGDFRQTEIIKSWMDFSKNHGDSHFYSASLTAHVSSGTYVRSICKELGSKLSSCALATKITRIEIGN